MNEQTAFTCDRVKEMQKCRAEIQKIESEMDALIKLNSARLRRRHQLDEQSLVSANIQTAPVEQLRLFLNQ
jgi:hypothetical protein